MSRSAFSVPPSPRARTASEASPEARLSYAEFLLGCDDLDEAAQRSVDWLMEEAGARQALCAAVDIVQNRLYGLAGHGVEPEQVRGLSLDLEDRRHPLLAALAGGKPVVFGGKGGEPRPPSSPLLAPVFMAVPLYGRFGKDDLPGGLLLVAPLTPAVSADTLWMAALLGHRMVRMTRLNIRAEADRRGRRERALLNAVPDPILLTDTEGRMLIANARARALLAAEEGESEGRRHAVALNNMLFSSALAQTAIQASPTPRELLLVDPSEGSDLLFELLSTVVSDPREGTGIVSILRNVTDLRRATQEIEENYRKLRLAEADVRAERDRLDLIIDSVADPILVSDPAGVIILMNVPAERLFTAGKGASAEETRRVSANDAHFSSFVSNLFFAGEASRRRGELGLVDPQTGNPLPVEAVAGKILSEHGEVTATVTILHDRTEEIEKARLYEQLKHASDELEQKVREATAELVHQNELLRRQSIELEQASNLKSQFLANMSHEFRTPLNAIMGYTSMLLQGVAGPLGPQQEKDLARVDSNARHLLAIINDILDISRIEAGKMPLHLSRFSLPDLIREVLAEVEPIIARTKLSVTSDIAPQVPGMLSDRPKVKQIVLNLLTNSLKFTPQGSVKVSTIYDPAQKTVAIAVADTGIGIAESDHQKIFEDFRQADASPARGYSGAGLGLAISRRLAVMLGGEIRLKSKVGKGSTFTLCLPPRPPKRR